MTYSNLDEIFLEKDKTVKAIHLMIDNLSNDQLKLKAPSGGWSVEEILEHMVKVDRSIIRLINLLIAKAAPSVGDANSGFPVDMTTITERGRREKYVAQESARPTGASGADVSMRELDNISIELKALRSALQRVDLSSAMFKHEQLGNLTLGQWLAFPTVHETRHMNQMLSILAANGIRSHTSRRSSD